MSKNVVVQSFFIKEIQSMFCRKVKFASVLSQNALQFDWGLVDGSQAPTQIIVCSLTTLRVLRLKDSVSVSVWAPTSVSKPSDSWETVSFCRNPLGEAEREKLWAAEDCGSSSRWLWSGFWSPANNFPPIRTETLKAVTAWRLIAAAHREAAESRPSALFSLQAHVVDSAAASRH